MLTKPLVDWLIPDHIRSSSSDSSTPSSPKYLSDDDGGLTRSLLGPCSSSDGNIFSSRTSSLQMLLRAPTWTVHYFWRKFDDTYMRPMFGGRCVQDSIRQEESRNSPIDDFPWPKLRRLLALYGVHLQKRECSMWVSQVVPVFKCGVYATCALIDRVNIVKVFTTCVWRCFTSYVQSCQFSFKLLACF